MDILFSLLLQVVLIGLNAIFACAELACISMNDAKVERLANEGNKKAKRLSRLKEDPAKFLATIQIAITLSGFLGSAFAAENFADYLVGLFRTLGAVNDANEQIFESVSVIIITIILSYFTLVFGELVPKRLAMKRTEGLSLGLASPLLFISKIFTPVVWFLTASTNAVLRLFGIDPNESEEEVSEEEIRLMVDAGTDAGVIDEDEGEMIQNVFEFGDLPVGDFATHRTAITFLWADDPVEEWDRTVCSTAHSYYPICRETADDIIGVLSAKKYLRLSDKTKESVNENAVETAHFVPASLHANILFDRMKTSKNHFAVVLDDYGGVEGIVTMNDILEQIVGDFNVDSGREEETLPKIEQLSDCEWSLNGAVPISDVNGVLGTDYSEDDFETFGSLVFSKHGLIPADGSTFEVSFDRLYVRVDAIKDHMIERAYVKTTTIDTEE